MSKVWYIHPRKGYSIILEKNKLLTHPTRWIAIELIMIAKKLDNKQHMLYDFIYIKLIYKYKLTYNDKKQISSGMGRGLVRWGEVRRSRREITKTKKLLGWEKMVMVLTVVIGSWLHNMSKVIKAYTWAMCSLLYSNYTYISLLFLKET